jgi:dihydrolipoamide dehydrogenase
MKKTNVVIIGGGTGGLVAAVRGAQNGLDITLVEKDQLGGTCINAGCIPSKALLNACDVAYRALHGGEMGIQAKVNVDYKKMIGWKEGIVEQIRSMSQRTLERVGVDVKRAKASFSSSNEIILSTGKGEESIKFDKAIIATGSKPIELPGFPFDHEAVLDSRQFLDLTTLPKRLLIVGAGYIGMELGTVCAKLGVDVTVIEMMDQILPGWDRRLVQPVAKKAEKLGIHFHFGLKASGIETEKEKPIVVAESKSGEKQKFPVDKILVTVGRKPLTDGLGLENTKVTIDKRGFIETNGALQTKDPNIYAIGDVAGEPMLAHKAFRDATIAVDSILGKETPPSDHVPAVVFTDPQIAQVGVSPDSREPSHAIGRAHFGAIGAAHTKGKTEGFARIVIDEKTGVILGADIVGPDASELIHELCIAVNQKLRAKDIVNTVHTHPTLSEIIAKAAENAGDLPPHSL